MVGLAIAAELSKSYQDIFVLEKNVSFGQETSSRNSEVIHTGIYYPKDSLKASTCIEGRQMLYEFCIKNNVTHKKIGKLIVAIDRTETGDLERLFKRGLENGVSDLKLLNCEELKKLEPNLVAEAGIYSPSTGIISSHGFMQRLISLFKGQGGSIAYNTELKGVEKDREGFLLSVEDKTQGPFKFLSRTVINCAGLNSDKVAAIAGLEKEEYRLKYCKGAYFRAHNKRGGLINRLIYPVPKERAGGLGIHATLDLAGSLRLGPDDEYVKEIDYNIDSLKQRIFYESVRKFLPFIEFDDLSPDMVGIRPKLQGPKEPFRDFIIKDEADNGLKGFINLIGIESPGLTSSLSIARIVKKMIEKV